MKDTEIKNLLGNLDGRGSDEEFNSVKSLESLGDHFPEILLNKYRSSTKWGDRASCVYHSIKYASKNEAAFQLGIEALKDRSKKVRYRACMLLAVSQNKKAIPYLELILSNKESNEDAAAAIDAINNKNHNYFVDRDHSGMVTLNV